MNGLKKWLDKPCIDPEVYTFREKLIARYRRWRFVRALKRNGAWDNVECFYDFANNIRVKEGEIKIEKP